MYLCSSCHTASNPLLQDESNLADRIGAPISARLAQLQQSSSSNPGAHTGGDPEDDENPTPMSDVADRLVDNEEFLDSIIKNLEDVSNDLREVFIHEAILSSEFRIKDLVENILICG